MFQLILLAAIVYILIQWLRRDGAPRRRANASPPPPGGRIEEMVQDPVCGTWVPLNQAIAFRRGRETLHFCSAECRDKFLAKRADG